MMFANCFYTDMTASASHAEARFACSDSASEKSAALILDAVIAASIIIMLISIRLAVVALVGLSVLPGVVLVLGGLLILRKMNRCRGCRTA